MNEGAIWHISDTRDAVCRRTEAADRWLQRNHVYSPLPFKPPQRKPQTLQSRDVLSLCDLHEFCPQNCKHNQMFIVLSLHFGVACHAAKENEKSLRDTSVTQAF